MAAYRADIEIGVRGAERLKELQDRITRLSRAVEDANVKTLIDRKAIQSIEEYSGAAGKAAKTLRETAIQLDAAGKASGNYAEAISQLVTTLGQENSALALQNNLIKEEIELRRKQKLAAGGIRETTQYAGPIGPGQASQVALSTPLRGRLQQLIDEKKAVEELAVALGELEERRRQEANAILDQRAASFQERFLAGKTQYAEPIGPGQASPVALSSQLRGRLDQILQLERASIQASNATFDAAVKHEQNLKTLKLKNDDEVFKAKLSQLDALAAQELKQIKQTDAAALADFDRRLENRVAKRQRTREATSNAVIGGAFPLLFGQGVGASIGGAAGGFAGGMLGGQFGFGLSLVGTAVGAAFDQLSVSAKDFAKASREGGDAASYLENTLGFLDPTIKKQIQNLQSSGQTAAAAELAFKQLANVMGKEGAEAFLAIGKQAEATDISIKKVTAGFIGAGLAANKFFAEARYGKNGSFTEFLPQQFRPTEAPGSSPETAALKQRTDELARGNAILALQAQLTSVSAKSDLDSYVIINKTIAQKEYALELSKIAIQLKNKEINLAQNEQLIRAANLALTVKLGNIERQRIDEVQRRQQEAERLQRERQQAAEQATKEQERLRQSVLNLNKEYNEAGAQNLETYAETLKALYGQEKATAYLLKSAEQYNDLKLVAFGYERAAASEAAKTATEEQLILQIYAQKNQQLKNQLITRQALLKTQQTQALYESLGASGILSPASQRNLAGAAALQTPSFITNQTLFNVSEQNKTIEETRLQLEKLLEPINQINSAAEAIGTSFGNSFKGVISGAMTAQEALAGFFQSVADQFMDMAAQIIAKWIQLTILNSILKLFPTGPATGAAASGNYALPGGAGYAQGFTLPSLLPGRAAGGPVSAGSPYIVGERGPELFVPGRSGGIVPNNQLGGDTTNVVVNVDASGSKVQGDEPKANELARVVSVAVQAELIKQKRPGGLLA